MAGFPKPGEQFGRYQVVRQIGRGGMGAVFEATDPTLGRSVAIKIVLPNFTDDEHYRERFAREAAVLAQLRSRHILQIHEYGEHEDALFLVTEFFPDGDLQSWLTRNGPMSRNAALTLVAQVCEGLYDAHEAGVVHRDVKPSNVLLWERKGRLIPYLCDFGIATSESHRLTRTGTMIGSLPYMAPERHLGDPADQRGDIYSTGCLLLAVLTGDAPFSGSDFQVMEAHIRKPAPQLDMADDLDVAINKVLSKALQKDPADRYPDSAAFERALNRLIQPGSRSEDAGDERPESTVPRKDVGAGAGGDAEDADDDAASDAGAESTTMRPLSREFAAADATTMRPLSQERPIETDRPVETEPPVEPEPPVEVEQATTMRPLSKEFARPDQPDDDLEGTTQRRAGLAAAGPIVPPEHPPAATPAAEGGDRQRRALLIAAAVAALLLVVGGIAYALTRPSSDSPTTHSSSHEPAVAAPKPPQVKARSQYRAVRFTVTPTSGGTMQIRLDGSWHTTANLTKATGRGDTKRCIDARALGASGRASDVVHACGRSAAPTITLVRCAGLCQGRLVLSGFAAGRSTVEMVPAGERPIRRPVVFDRHGRNRDLYFSRTYAGARVKVTCQGVTKTVTVRS